MLPVSSVEGHISLLPNALAGILFQLRSKSFLLRALSVLGTTDKLESIPGL